MFGKTALEVLKSRYLLKDESKRVVETPDQMFRRVAKAVARADKKYDKNANLTETEEKFYNLMSSLDFLPNSPTLMNAGTRLGQLAACFVLPIEDSLTSIFDTLKYSVLIHQSGGGTGFSFSKLRPEGDIVRSTKGVASGPVSFVSIFDKATDVIKQGGKRRGANMGVLSVTHPDVIKFADAKLNGDFQNFNFSISVTDNFMRAAEKNQKYDLINPRTGKKKAANASEVFKKIISAAHTTGDPGLLFSDAINKANPILGTKIEATNPCSEQPLLPYESCTLGSINLSNFVVGASFDLIKLASCVKTAVHFLDNVIDTNNYPLPQIKEATQLTRKIGLGVMGWADALIELEIPYTSETALKLASQIMKFISEHARDASMALATRRGSFPLFRQSTWKRQKRYKRIRNATLTTVAPTGSISIIAGCSSGIEPIFSLSYLHEILGGEQFREVTPMLYELAKRYDVPKGDLSKIVETGSLRGHAVPRHFSDLFAGALDIPPEQHVKMQAAFQKYVDSGVSKTVNLPKDASKQDIEEVYKLAWKLGCKGITVYRYGSKEKQVLSIGKKCGVC